ncbi:2-oxoacid:acceptor oxidoreductase subunit alpha [Candidatus Roizmanbacteria bacterium]|nr:2-oxoacid:acceptor oxidoreductase subunit alpha [Candidatus Roizmanbacteria bacterium]
MNNFLWKIGGEAGFGIMTAGLTLSKIASRSGYHIFDYAEYPSLIRGGHNTYEVLISSDKLYATREHIDLLVCLNKETYLMHKSRLSQSSIVVYDGEEFSISENYIKVEMPFKRILKELQGQQLMANTTALAASVALLKGDASILHDIITVQFNRKGQEVVEYNKKFAEAGFSHIQNNYKHLIRPVLERRTDAEKLVLSGNEAFSLGSVMADCRFYAAYPMTPTSIVLSILAEWQVTTGMVVRHAEDEISVVNTALGAAHAGVRGAVGTSGGGFALMVETLSYAGIAEIPLVVFLGQRPGPATGMPTWTEQGDLLFACHAGHGEFPKIVLAPGDPKELLELTMAAFNLADSYQLPVVIMGDKVLCESHMSVYRDEVVNLGDNYHIVRGKTVNTPSELPYLRYLATPDGISERLIPGAAGVFYQANSYEHTQDSHTSEDAAERKTQVEKRNKKWQTYLHNDFQLPKVYGDFDHSDIVFVSWGGNKGAILEAQKLLQNTGIRSAYLHFTHIYPLNKETILQQFPKGKRYILVENNSHAQFGKLLAMETGMEISEKILRYDGRPIAAEEIMSYITHING